MTAIPYGAVVAIGVRLAWAAYRRYAGGRQASPSELQPERDYRTPPKRPVLADDADDAA